MDVKNNLLSIIQTDITGVYKGGKAFSPTNRHIMRMAKREGICFSPADSQMILMFTRKGKC